jgi:hypothetical protein
MKDFKRVIAVWLPLAAVTTALCGLVFAAVQQSLRQSANDPQIQIAEDAASALARGESPESVLRGFPVDIAGSLAPFTVVYDGLGTAIASSGLLHGQPLHLPDGVLASARLHGESRLTIQPEPSARIAGVIVPYSGSNSGFVLSGRSLREVEARTSQLRIFVVIAWFAALAVSLLIVFAKGFLAAEH